MKSKFILGLFGTVCMGIGLAFMMPITTHQQNDTPSPSGSAVFGSASREAQTTQTNQSTTGAPSPSNVKPRVNPPPQRTPNPPRTTHPVGGNVGGGGPGSGHPMPSCDESCP